MIASITLLLFLVMLFLRCCIVHRLYKPIDFLTVADTWTEAMSLSFTPIIGFADADVDPSPDAPLSSGNYSRVR